ncbi:MAG TPA: DUF998 domain-containing protein, partial [Chloroflexota bacterium]|nr:DUF998 domain-containing protein [Chloroflexota bacterium]
MAESRVGRACRAIGIISPPNAAVLVVAAAAVTPGYDPVSRTISRLAVPGMPAAAAVDMAIVLVATTCFALALLLRRGASSGRIALVVAGIAFILSALIHLDPASTSATVLHRAASGVGVIGLTVAPLVLARDYGPICSAIGAAEVVMLLAAL